MERRIFLKSLAISIPSLYCSLLSAKTLDLSKPLVSSNMLVTGLNINLSTPGRLGFYIDYSERSSLGEHIFYVCRTHGTQGSVSVSYSTLGDAHTTTSGTFTWADGEADIKSFTVNVTSKSDGEHRIYAQLSNPTGGAVLHHGAYSIAYGIIDDESIAPDSDAVFYDANAGTNGNGSRSNPYNSIYDAIANVGNKRYIYGKGSTIPDGTNTCSPGGVGIANCITAPASRTGENDRLYIRNWPGFSWVVSGGGSISSAGFFARNGQSYQTYKGINFQDLDSSAEQYVNGFAIYYNYGGSKGINIELCTALNINGSTNNGAYMPWGVDGSKIWRSISNNIQQRGDNTNTNTSGIFTYNGKNISVQRCEMYNSNSAIYHKRTVLGDTSTSARFNIIETFDGVHYGASGSSGVSHSYTIVQSNLFKGCAESGIHHRPGSNINEFGMKHWWCSNVFDRCGRGERGAITFEQGYGAQIFNNIFLDCRKVWSEYTDTSNFKPGVEYANYNHEEGTTLNSQTYEWKGTNFSTAAALFTVSGFAGNDSRGDPMFTGNDYNLAVGSPCLLTGVSGTNKGIYLTGVEKIGVSGTGGSIRPSNPTRIGVS